MGLGVGLAAEGLAVGLTVGLAVGLAIGLVVVVTSMVVAVASVVAVATLPAVGVTSVGMDGATLGLFVSTLLSAKHLSGLFLSRVSVASVAVQMISRVTLPVPEKVPIWIACIERGGSTYETFSPRLLRLSVPRVRQLPPAFDVLSWSSSMYSVPRHRSGSVGHTAERTVTGLPRALVRQQDRKGGDHEPSTGSQHLNLSHRQSL